ncbi:LytTR family transcriptional regulator DNA-binding domain-containing protein [Paenibacillus athensensis]|uniref:HTH LytTR-type domain-containing protein n=1 Tax=Paenibacillus athensensis TaxID=1967502 RepID=A0A4Y8Q0J8_9BACL|nr:LytTR family transcriptional regulator DNA-binding domain-containing protein [Paenibacillus athensensis]MCD1258322.1 LytTR family transcriptional regulator DNA-binding domain-containing protein [Paenibacillus athensensis]
MNVAIDFQNTYQDFVLEKDIYYFRIGERGLVSFHGKNYHTKKRMSTDQIAKLTAENAFFKVNTDCYANIQKVSAVHDGIVQFEVEGGDSKSVSITKLRQHQLKELLVREREDH